MDKKYKWSHPGEWLLDKINNTEDVAELRSIARSCVDALDSDKIQDIFQSEMNNDGYFEPESEWRVLVGNIGQVYSGTDEASARETYSDYENQSMNVPGCRAYGESVVLLKNDEVEQELEASGSHEE